jgi:SHAQKYF class myb-like DNA-binding protein
MIAWTTELCSVAPLVYPTYFIENDLSFGDRYPAGLDECEAAIESFTPTPAFEPKILYTRPARLTRNYRGHIIWNGELHERFTRCVEELGEHAVPSVIVKMMNVPGLTREHVASHLQKFKDVRKKKAQKILSELLDKNEPVLTWHNIYSTSQM